MTGLLLQEMLSQYLLYLVSTGEKNEEVGVDAVRFADSKVENKGVPI